MTVRQFRFRLNSKPGAPAAEAQPAAIDLLDADGCWQPQRIDAATPGFRLYLIALLLCLHTAIVMQSADLGLALQEVQGELQAQVLDDWSLEAVEADLRLRFAGSIAEGGLATALEQIRARMDQCPVSRNLPGTVRKRFGVSLA